MAKSTFERDPRAASSSSPRPGYDARRATRSSDPLRTGVRLAVRGLLVAGFAGAAWLLSSSAAHASEGTTGTGTTSTTASTGTARVTSLVTPYDSVTSPVTALGDVDGFTLSGLLSESPARPDRTAITAATAVVTGVVPEAASALGPDGALRSARANGATAATAGTTAATPTPLGVGLLHTPLGLGATPGSDGPRGLDGLALDRPLDLNGALGLAQPRVRPAPSAGLLTRVGLLKPTGQVSRVHTSGLAKAKRTADHLAGRPATSTTAVTTGTPAAIGTADTDGSFVVRARTAITGSRHRAVAGHTPVRLDDRTGWHGTYHRPMLPRPAPLPAYPGSGTTTGVPSSISVPGHDGGASALVPAFFATAPVVVHRPARAVDTPVRRVFAEDPTVSPD